MGVACSAGADPDVGISRLAWSRAAGGQNQTPMPHVTGINIEHCPVCQLCRLRQVESLAPCHPTLGDLLIHARPGT